MKLCMGCMNQIDEKMTVCPHCGFNEATLKQESYYLKPGTVVGGKYIVGKALSYGGYTVTYLGLDAEKNRKVMIKEYLPSDFSTRPEGDTEVTIYSGDACDQFEQGLTTFLNEANRIQQLQNPQGIMRVYDCVAENDTGYVISEYLEGKTLEQIMEEGRRFSVQEAKDFVCRILEGLRQVHPLDIIHCDISPETIFVTNTGEIKLLDFGATRYVTTANSKSLAIILKQGFAPEEQYRSRGERGPWTDVYALGAVMYYMITGVVPVESVDRALMDELKEPSKLGVQIPANIENALMNALNVYQNDRTPSAEIFYQELNSPQVNRIQVKKQKYETGKFPTWAKFLVAGMLCVVVGGCVFFVGMKDKSSTDAKPEKPPIPQLSGWTLGEAQNIVDKEIPGEEIRVEEEGRIYNRDEKLDGTIWNQNPNAGQASESIGVITVNVYTSKECTYGDLLEKQGNVDALAEAFNIDRKKIKKSEEKDNDDRKKKYKDLYRIVLEDGQGLKPKDLENDINNVITLAKIKSVEYYVSPYLYKEELEDYKGKNINTVHFKKYFKKNKKGKPEYVKGTSTPACKKEYYSFTKAKGEIVYQYVDPGKEYDSADEKGELFNIVKEKFDDGNSPKELEKKLIDSGMKVEYKGSGSEIDKIKVKDGSIDLFKRGDTITIILKKPEPRSTPESKTSSGGNSSSKSKIKNSPDDDMSFSGLGK